MDQEAVTAPVALSIAMALFLSLFAAVSLTTDRVGDGDAAEASDAARLRAQAQNLLDLMLQSPGYSAGGADWVTPDVLDGREDGLIRLGLREAGGNSLSFDKFENLRLAPYEAGSDDFVNYEEARAALGLDDAGLGFHVRAKPSLQSVQQVLSSGVRDENMKVTYLAATDDSGEAQYLTVSNLQCARDDTVSPPQLRVSLDVENEGLQDAQLNAFVTLSSFEDETTRSEWINGPVVANDGVPVSLSSSFPFYDDPDTTDLCGAGATVTTTIWDSTQSLKTASTTLGAGVSGVSGHTHGLTLDTGTQFSLYGDDASFAYGGTELDTSQDLTFELVGPAGGTASTYTLNLQAGNVNKRTIVVGDDPSGHHVIDTGTDPLDPGTYTATLTDGTATVSETLYVFSSAPNDYSELGFGGSTITSGGKVEVAHLHDLVEYFCPFHHDDATHTRPILDPTISFSSRCHWDPHDDGDVILDTKKNMDDDLPTRLIDSGGEARYDIVSTLVVGSNVNHQAMTSASAKHAVRDWVLGGGTLLVFGSSEQAVQWLQPIFQSGIQSSSGGIGTPDADHPLLQVSDTLAYDQYDNQGRVWDLKDQGAQSSADKFTNVVDASGDAILTISDPGAYGDGTIILTTWMPYDLFGDGSDPGTEGLKLVNNMLMESYRGLFLDYGPPLPDGRAVVPASGKAQVFHPELGRLVSLDVTLFIFEQT